MAQETIQGPADLEQLRQQLTEFRHSQPVRSRLPEPLWAAATELATRYGVHRIARELHLDYTGLKKRVQQCERPKQKRAVSATRVLSIERTGNRVKNVNRITLSLPSQISSQK